MNPQDIQINVLLKDEAGVSIARCPQLGIVATAPNRAAAMDKLQQLIGIQINYAQKTDRLGEILRADQTVAWLLSKDTDDGYAVVR